MAFVSGEDKQACIVPSAVTIGKWLTTEGIWGKEGVSTLAEEVVQGEEDRETTQGEVAARYHLNMVAERGVFPPGLDFGELGWKGLDFEGLGLKGEGVDHHHVGDGAEDGVTLRCVSGKMDTVMWIMQ